ncbi:MAG: hypothetical protein GWN01_01415 [Nitrosopumilaceae archaeon]|nr:hypothetical protein [Nitrosopumilaceae archaeon]NIU86017.1 hypothetical protein [Nitrosopumilaceae archaeon]NIX60236.1 hypothetical protein [Nitrosopumilaceae archaeon]
MGEPLQSWKDNQPNYLFRGVEYNPENNVISILMKKEFYPSGKYDLIYEPYYGKNIVTDAGDEFYAQELSPQVATPTNDFFGSNNRIELQNPGTADTPAKTDTYGDVTSPITASRDTLETGYPTDNDTETFNTGKDVDALTYKYLHAEGDFDTEGANNITGGCIHVGGATPAAGTPLLSHFNYTTPFGKSSTDQLITYINHKFNGV